MADKSPTASTVLASANAEVGDGVIGAATTLTAGDSIYQDPTTLTWLKSNASTAPPVSKACAIALTGGSAGQPVHYVTEDPKFFPGFAIAVHEVIIVSGTAAGKLCPIADNATGWYWTFAMVGIGSNFSRLKFVNSGVPKP
ncbi:MAG: hypothetical protein V7609_2077 [Verrucomicrobiota bacterium]